MSPPRPTLPWLLLALSLAANVWLTVLSRPRHALPGQSARFVTNLVTNPGVSEGDNVTRLVTLPTQPPGKAVNSPPPAALASASPPAPPSAIYAAYADLLALSLETAAQHDELARVLGRWIATDPASASEWLNRQPDDPRYDLPVSQVAVHLTAQGDYALAREWADSIRTPEVRATAIEEVLAEQYRHRQLTPETLAAAAHRAGLSPDRVQGILNYSRLD